MCYLSESVENELDSEGNVIPVVAITSFKDYIDENNVLNASNGHQNEIDFESFNRHQTELYEMQRKQMERLRHNCQTNVDLSSVSNRSGYNPCNCEHSSSSVLPSVPTTASHSSSKPSAKRQSSMDSMVIRSAPPSLQFSTLDSASAHFAVSVVRSASELTHNRTHNSSNSSSNDSSKDTPQNCYSISIENKCEKTMGSVGTIGSTNGPINEKELLRKTIKSETSLPSTTPTNTTSLSSHMTSNTENDLKETIDPHNSHSPLTLLTPLPSTPTPCKLKYQNRSQKTNTSIPPTDVT